MCLPSFNEWFLVESNSGQINSPAELDTDKFPSIKAIVPGTVAQTLHENNLWDIDSQRNFDSSDWWYSTTFDLVDMENELIELNFEGLATLCDIWVNGQLIHQSRSMFLTFKLNISNIIKPHNTLHLCFRSLTAELKVKKPRPRWKTKLVDHQNLRWIRTTLLGKIPGWSPPISAVGPWKPITFTEPCVPQNVKLTASVKEAKGLVDIEFELFGQHNLIDEVIVTVGDIAHKLNQSSNGNCMRAHGQLVFENVKLWWPHTHGEPYLHPVKIEVISTQSRQIYELPSIGFKRVHVDQTKGGYDLHVNDQLIFCRGACWTINDIISLVGNEKQLENTLVLMKQAGANMIRVGGTMVYEQNLFYELCDQLGILIWQDFMFANMDYPTTCEEFSASVKEEITQQLIRLRSHPCIAVYCGNSEVLQQASMMGLSVEKEANGLFDALIPKLCSEHHKEIPYIASSPIGGALPFHPNTGLTHYYGIGAYQRPIQELRSHDVKFSPEALGFANVPVAHTRNHIFSGGSPVVHDARWKQRTPRDSGTGWDFEDIRDYYFQILFNQDPIQLRYSDPDRYLRLSETVTGELMHQVYSEWRSGYSKCTGGLIWFLKDLWPGAGWGVIDSFGIPKACYYYLKRVWQPISIVLTDENINGLHIHVINESNEPLEAELYLQVFHKGRLEIANCKTGVEVKRQSKTSLNADSMLGQFYDLTNSYRFGPKKHNFVLVQLIKNKSVLCQKHYFPDSEFPDFVPASEIEITATEIDSGDIEVKINSKKLLFGVNIECEGYFPDDNYFHLAPNFTKHVTLRKSDIKILRFKCYLSALNLESDKRINLN